MKKNKIIKLILLSFIMVMVIAGIYIIIIFQKKDIENSNNEEKSELTGLWVSGDESKKYYYEIIIFTDNTVEYTKYHGCIEYFGCENVGEVVDDVKLGYVENGNIIFNKTKNSTTNKISKKDIEFYGINMISASLFNLEETGMNFEKISDKTKNKQIDINIIEELEQKAIFTIIDYNEYKDLLNIQKEWYLYICDENCLYKYHNYLYSAIKDKNIKIKYLDVDNIQNENTVDISGYPTLFKYNGGKVIEKMVGKQTDIKKIEKFFESEMHL